MGAHDRKPIPQLSVKENAYFLGEGCHLMCCIFLPSSLPGCFPAGVDPNLEAKRGRGSTRGERYQRQQCPDGVQGASYVKPTSRTVRFNGHGKQATSSRKAEGKILQGIGSLTG